MSKRQLIDEILRVNRTVKREFLVQFKENELQAYLDRVCVIADTLVKTRVTEPSSLAA